MMSPKICSCNQVNKDTILEAIQSGADTVEEIGKKTKAGTGCGSCQWTLEQIVSNSKKQ